MQQRRALHHRRNGLAAASAKVAITLHGSGASDGVALRRLAGAGTLVLRGLPVRALPWREAAIYDRSDRRPRPKVGEPDTDDPMAQREVVLDTPEAIRRRTDIEGAARLSVSGGQVAITAMDGELWLPRLRLIRHASLHFDIAGIAADARVGLAVYADGRRMGGAMLGSVRIPGQDGQ